MSYTEMDDTFTYEEIEYAIDNLSSRLNEEPIWAIQGVPKNDTETQELIRAVTSILCSYFCEALFEELTGEEYDEPRTATSH